MTTFNALYITTEGSGSYHANRYRIYFRTVGDTTVARLNDELIREFTSVFNGSVSGGTTNVATVVRRSDLSWRGEAPLQFTLDAVGPDVRDDWVGIVWKEAGRGFAAQTLQLRQSIARDVAIRIIGGGFGAFVPLGGFIIGEVGDLVDEEIMLSHFLAGRRSWVIGDAFDDLSGNHLREPPTGPGQVFFLETGAIERFSTWFYDLSPTADIVDAISPGGSIRAAIDIVWRNLLENYIDFKGSAIEVLPSSAIDLTRSSPDWQTLGSEGAVCMWQSFSGYRDIRERGWTDEMMRLHPALEMQLPRVVPDDIDAALAWGSDRAYFFKGSQYWRYDLGDDQCEWDYPKRISSGWPGLPSSIDAAVDWGNDKAYFFQGSQYWRWSKSSDALDSGYPKSISSEWPGLPDGIDAIVDRPTTGKVYFFKGDQYWRWDKEDDSLDDGYPKSIADNWSGLPGSIDAAMLIGLTRAYFFKGGQYYRWHMGQDSPDSGYPKPISQHW